MSKCSSGKVAYKSRRKAIIALDHQLLSIKKYGNHTPEKGPGAKTVYRCPDCGKFHLTRTGSSKTWDKRPRAWHKPAQGG